MDSDIALAGAYEDRPGGSGAWPELMPGDVEEFGFDENPWAWADFPGKGETERVDIAGAHVTAVLVTLDAARWLPATLEALAKLDTRPTRLIAIDNASTDATRTLLDRAHDQGVLDAVYGGSREFGFGDAVNAALELDIANLQDDADTIGFRAVSARDTYWLWLLHDDAVVAPDALYQLLAHVTTDQSIDLTGPKLLLPRRRHGGQPISEIGVSISDTGRRELDLDVDEIDQGQRDEPQERLGVSTCGMLVRTAVWEQLDGLDPALPVFRDGVEFGWRAHLNGYRVVTTPRAQLTHRQVGRAGLRPHGLTGRRPGKVDRLLGMLVVAGHAPAKRLPLVWLRLVWSCLLRAVGYLIGKVPGRALDEILALGSFVAHPGQLRGLRRRTAAIDPAPGTDEVVDSLRPPWWSGLQVGLDALTGTASERYRLVAGDSDVASIDELTGDDFSSAIDARPKNVWLSPAAITVAAAIVASFIAARSLLGSGSLVAPALLPAHDSVVGLWRTVVSAIPGAPAQVTPPWEALAALASTAVFGQPEWFTTLLLCGVVPLSLLAAYPLARRVINDRRVRLWVCGTYALLPVLLGGTNQGRLALSVVAIGLPLLVMAARALVLRRTRTPEAWRGGWGAGVVLVALVAFEPSMIIFAVLVGILGAIVLRRSPRKIGRIGIALGVPLVVLLPWWPTLISAPGRLFVGPDSALTGVTPAAPVWQLLLGREVGPGLPPLWVGAVIFGVIWVVALLGLARRPARRAVVAAWAAALVAFGMAVVLSRLVVSVPPAGTEVRPWAGSYLLLGFAALIISGGMGLDGFSADVKERSFSWLQPATVIAGIVVCLISAGGAVWWVLAGAHGPIERSRLDAIPPYVMNAMKSDARPRLLAIDLIDGTARYSVLADDHLRLGDADRGFTFGGSVAAREQVDDLVVRLVAGTADSDINPQLTNLGIGYVWVTGANDDIQARIDNTPGLGTASGNERGIVWKLEPTVARTVVVDGSARLPIGTPPAPVPAGKQQRQLRIGESADVRWRAELNGSTLAPAADGWQQVFALPADGGTVTYTLPSLMPWLLPLQGLVLLIAGVLAAPAIRRPEVRDPAKTARRAATLSELA
ncbi:MAG TPA: glycosyltransferase [Propionibacteriaceae bacterium]|nr:glycosyltransferase [Propionibacteriaceae bacterium]